MASSVVLPPAVSVGPDAATVSVSVPVPVTPEEAWSALTRPERVRQWLGELCGEVRPGTPVRLDFRDGDFFDMEVTSVQPPSTLAFRWRFLGIGPSCSVRWLVQQGEQTHVEVRDSTPLRSADESRELGSGWADFLERYRAYLSTGRCTRYPWRAELEGAIELPEATPWLLDAGVWGRWLPLTSEGQSMVFHAAGDQAAVPWRLRVEHVRRVRSNCLQLVLAAAEGSPPSTCRLELRSSSAGGSLSFSHDRWQRLLADDDDRRGTRARLARTWVDALVKARALLEH